MIGEVIRGFIGFDGLLMSDDVSMGALSGSIAERARASLAAGCDLVLHCNGKMDEMRAVAAEAPELAGDAKRRAAAALAVREVAGRRLILPAARREFAAMMAARIGLMSEAEAFETEIAERGSDEPALLVDVEGFEGPLDLLLALARQQKVDLAKISILALAEQYLAFIEEARKLRLELAADYLVMAAWLAYLKSRLLLPEPAEPRRAERRGHGQRAGLAAEAAGGVPRSVAASSWAGRSCSATCSSRGDPEPIADIKHPQWTATLYDLLTAYARQRQQSALSHVPLQAAQRLGACRRRAKSWSG